MARQQWSSRSTFIMAAIGSTVGLGNVWRFPGIVYANGGGVFLIPYVIALLTAGIPLLALELSIGKKYQCGAPSAFAKMNKKFEWLGWWGVGIAFLICTYYSVVVAWVIHYVALSFTSPWIEKSTADIFTDDVTHISSGMFDIGGFNPIVVLALIFAWVSIWYCIHQGITAVGKVVKYTVILSVILIIFLIVRSITLPGAMDGLRYYLVPEWSVLLDINVWAAAYGQIFFSLSILFSIMVAYGSYLNRDAEVTKDVMIIGFAVAGISFLSGLAVFGTLGYLSKISGVAISDMKYTGVMLAFITYPEALAQMPGGRFIVILFSLVFFIMLFILAIDSAYSIMEAIVTAVVDKFDWNKEKTAIGVCILGFLSSLIFATKAGIHWLDIIDHFVNDFNLIAIGFFECLAFGWILGSDQIRDYLNSNTSFKYGKWWSICIKFICPVVLLLISVTTFIISIKTPYEGYTISNLLVGGWGGIGLTIIFGIMMSSIKEKKVIVSLKDKKR